MANHYIDKESPDVTTEYPEDKTSVGHCGCCSRSAKTTGERDDTVSEVGTPQRPQSSLQNSCFDCVAVRLARNGSNEHDLPQYKTLAQCVHPAMPALLTVCVRTVSNYPVKALPFCFMVRETLSDPSFCAHHRPAVTVAAAAAT